MDIEPDDQTLTMEAVVQALESAMAARDPYTVGHQQRVTDIACKIAGGMDLLELRIQELRVAGRLHDLGKIAIPCEILAKPGKLTDIEFAMIKTHPQAAHDILKPLNLPGRFNQIILQHHERLNGCGYPRGLQGEEILLESQILAVADVLEAMCSHRPYRPALGLERALEELSRNKGILYNDLVVEACLQLYGKDSKIYRHLVWKPAGRPQRIPDLSGAKAAAGTKRAKLRRSWASWRRRPFSSVNPRFLLHSVTASAMAAIIMLAARGSF